MPKRILIDATHSEETWVVTLENGRIQEFDSETSIKQQLKGNIYLAKVTRVEPSLQAAFVEYGGNRHGFLPFSEIHPDYYNLPHEDKQKLLDDLRRAETQAEDEEEEEEEQQHQGDDKPDAEADSESEGRGKESSDEPVEVLESEEEEASESAKSSKTASKLHRVYKIQEVIRRNQIILVQVEKEERGNKGASLTTFISLAGKYCVLMPNSLRKGGVSRRIGSYEDRKRLKKVLRSFNLPQETGLIVRTAGAGKSEVDIRRDYDYLVGLWNNIRAKTLSSDAPAFIHAEEDLVKRIIRDAYNDTVDEVLIAGEGPYESARQFMEMLMPEHVSKIRRYKNKVPIFSRYRVDEQLAMLYDHEVSLQSGGSIVISPTEALISIDVNSGKSTTQRSVEETALTTNLEAAHEIARQLKLRDLSGLIVIDFIDMLDVKNRKAVERAVKDAFRLDKARIQIGRISSFGLLEMSRQRLRPSFYEVNTMPCPHCHGTGHVKASETIAVSVLRGVAADLSRNKVGESVDVYVSPDVATYILNHKRDKLTAIERRFSTQVLIYPDHFVEAEGYKIEKLKSNRRDDNDNGRGAVVPDVAANDESSNGSSKDNAKKGQKKPQKKVKLTNILDGLWKKIVD